MFSTSIVIVMPHCVTNQATVVGTGDTRPPVAFNTIQTSVSIRTLPRSQGSLAPSILLFQTFSDTIEAFVSNLFEALKVIVFLRLMSQGLFYEIDY